MGIAGATNASNPMSVAFVEGQDDFTEYLSNRVLRQKLGPAYLSFQVEDSVLNSVVLYPVENGQCLSEEEIAEIVRHTSGQLSDGIGETFEQEPCAIQDGVEIYISPWCREQKLTARLVTVTEP